MAKFKKEKRERERKRNQKDSQRGTGSSGGVSQGDNRMKMGAIMSVIMYAIGKWKVKMVASAERAQAEAKQNQ